MTIETKWDNPQKTIILQDFPKTWSSKDFIESIMLKYRLMTSVTHTVHAISDVSKIGLPPTGIITSLPMLERQIPTNYGMHIILGNNPMFYGIINISKKIAPKLTQNLLFAETLDEAYRIIRNQDQTYHR